jgi:hypothetical protein
MPFVILIKFKKIDMNKILIVAIAFILMAGIQSCNNEETTNNGSAILKLKLIDSEGDYLEVNVNIVDIRYNQSDGDEGWLSFGDPTDYPIQVDLTQLISGNNLILADEVIPAGDLKQIRLVLGEGNTLVIEDENGDPYTVPLNTPSALQSGLKLHFDTVLEPGFTYVYILDWDVNESIVEAGNSGNYNLKPVINAIVETSSGSISGRVLDELTPIQDAIVQVFKASDEYVNSTITNEFGEFMASGLTEGEYILKIVEDGYEPYESPADITVVIGEINDVGDITLTPL